MVSDACPLGNLVAWIRREGVGKGKLTLWGKKTIMYQVAAGMEHLHSCGVLHGNLTVRSVLVCSEEPLVVKVMRCMPETPCMALLRSRMR